MYSAGVGLPLGGLPLSSQPLLVSPTGPTLSPTGKTPLATYFEESLNPSLVSPAAAAGAPGAGAPGLSGVPGLSAAAAADGVLKDGLAGLNLGSQAGAQDNLSGGLGKLDLGVTPGGTSAAPRSYSPLGGGLSLFGDPSLLVPSSTAGASGPNSSGAPAGLVGV